MTNTEYDSEIIFDPTKPRLKELCDEYARINPASLSTLGVSATAEDIRFNVWDNQDASCTKVSNDGYTALPWENASDTRVYLADDVCNTHVATCVTAFWSALMRAEGTEAADAPKGAVTTRLLQWMVQNRMRQELWREVQLSAQYLATYGWTVLHPTWLREVSLRRHRLEIESLPEEYQALVLDPALEDMAIATFQEVYAGYIRRNLAVLRDMEIPTLPVPIIRRAIRKLRNSRQTDVPIPYVAKNQPSIVALKPWQEVLLATDNGDINRSRVYVRRSFTEDELYERVMLEGWDEEWVEQACQHKGRYSVWNWETTKHPNGTASGTPHMMLEEGNPTQIEVVFAYTRRLDDSGVPGIYVTVFHPLVTGTTVDDDLVATHGLCDFSHGAMPMVLGAREWLDRSVLSSRGVPEIAFPSQRVVKANQDAQIDKANVEVLPPLMVPQRYMKEDLKWGPLSKIPILPGVGTITPAQVGGSLNASMVVIEREERWLARYFGLLHEAVPLPDAQLKQSMLVSNFLAMWHGALQQAMALCIQYVSAEEWQRITGAPKPASNDPAEVSGQYDLILTFDPRTLDMEHTLKELDVIQKAILPMDAAGVIDRAKYVQLALMAINPVLARELVSDQASASQKLYRETEAQLNSMMLGNPPTPVENDPTAGRKLQYAQQIVAANPLMQQAAQQAGMFQEHLRAYAKNLMFSVKEDKNKTAGRIGVDPDKMGGPQ